jgi:hypothetical protein
MVRDFDVPFNEDNFFEPERAESAYEFNDWSEHQSMLFDNATSGIGWGDTYAETLFHEGFVNPDLIAPDRELFQETLVEYMEQEYGIDFYDLFDYDAWAEEFYGND